MAYLQGGSSVRGLIRRVFESVINQVGLSAGAYLGGGLSVELNGIVSDISILKEFIIYLPNYVYPFSNSFEVHSEIFFFAMNLHQRWK